MDLYVSKGNVDAMHDRAAEDPSSLMLGSAKDRFVELTTPAGLVSFRASARPSDAR